MTPLWDWILYRLGENSTWRGIVLLLTSLGITIDPEQFKAIISVGLAIVGLINVIRKAPGSKDSKQPVAIPDPGPIVNSSGSAMTRTLVGVALVGILAAGCAGFSTTQTDISYETNGAPMRKIITKAGGHTFFSARSSLASWKAAQSDKTQGASVGGLSNEASGSGTNLLSVIQALEKLAVLIK
jgi:hypothetical protein